MPKPLLDKALKKCELHLYIGVYDDWKGSAVRKNTSMFNKACLLLYHITYKKALRNFHLKKLLYPLRRPILNFESGLKNELRKTRFLD